MRRAAHIGYLLNAFPVVSETFVLNELRAVEARGIPVVILSLSPRTTGLEHGTVRGLRAVRLHPPACTWARAAAFCWAHLGIVRRHPSAYLRAAWEDIAWGLAGAVRGQGRRFLRKRLARHLLAGWLAHVAERSGVVHLHAHYAKEPAELAARVRRLTGIPYSVAAHAKDLYTAPRRRLARRLRRASFAVACHPEGARILRRLAAGACEVLHLPHGVDTALFHPGRRRPEPGLILAVGRLRPKKGFDILVQACGILRAEGRRFRCLIVGEGSEAFRLRATAASVGVADRVELRGFLPQEELPAWYGRAALLVVPSRVTADGNRDGIPNVLVEAMACGVPVVATAVGGIPEVVRQGRTGLLVPPGDPVALAAAMARLLDDPCRAEALGHAGAVAVAALDYRHTALPLIQRFRAACGAPGEELLEEVARKAWARGGLADQAAALLGCRPRRRRRTEAAIVRGVAPGIWANAWRADLERLVRRRLWDEVYKAVRAGQLGLGASAPLRTDGRVLDLGCGRGGLSVALAARGTRVVAFDLRYRNCRVARWRGSRYGLALPAAVGRAEALPFADASFELVCCLEVLEHVADPAALLREVRRVLVEGGRCAVTVVNRWAHRDPHYHLWGVNFLPRRAAASYIRWRAREKYSGRDAQRLEEMHYFSYRRFVSLARRAGFQVRELDASNGHRQAPLRWLRRWTSLGFNTATFLLTAAGLPDASGQRPAPLPPGSRAAAAAAQRM